MNANQYLTLSNSASKRALFTSYSSKTFDKSDDEDSLGHMSPLKSSSPDRYSSPRHSPCLSLETPLKMSDSDDNIVSNEGAISNVCRNIHSTLNESTPQKMYTDIIDDTIIEDTPEKECNSDMLTPFKCLIRKHRIEETPDSFISKRSGVIKKICWKKKEQIASSSIKENDSENCNFDFNSKVANLIKNSFYRPVQSKAKTALYPKLVKINRPALKVVPKVHIVRKPSVNSNFRKTHKRSRIIPGEINAGVRHKIKRPKIKVKRSVEPVRKSMEKPLITPVDRIRMYVVENNLIDDDSTPVKRPRLDNKEQNDVNERNCHEFNSESAPSKYMNMSLKENTENSPEIDVLPDPNKKFFKTNRTMAIDHKATVTVVNNLKFEVHKGKVVLGNNSAKKVKPFKKRPVLLENLFEEDTVLDTSAVQETVQEVLQKLDSEIPSDLQNIQSITTSTSALVLHDNEEVNVTEPMGDTGNENVATSKQKVIIFQELESDVENQIPEDSANFDSPDACKKLYPVFYKRKVLYDATNDNVRKSPHIKKMRLIGENQYQIDAGQSRFRATNCRECGTLYHVGDPEDEIAHYNIHNNISTFRFSGWKNEHVIKLYEDGERVIIVYPDDPKVWVNKAKDILGVVDKEMGFVDFGSSELGNNKVYLYVQKNRIIGVLAAEPKTEAYRMLDVGVEGPDCCSEESYPVICGISRIWTAPDKRRKGVATRLVDSLRLSFMFDHFMDKKEIAFSVPTDQGKFFAKKYMQTAEFMVYYK